MEATVLRTWIVVFVVCTAVVLACLLTHISTKMSLRRGIIMGLGFLGMLWSLINVAHLKNLRDAQKYTMTNPYISLALGSPRPHEIFLWGNEIQIQYLDHDLFKVITSAHEPLKAVLVSTEHPSLNTYVPLQQNGEVDLRGKQVGDKIVLSLLIQSGDQKLVCKNEVSANYANSFGMITSCN